MTKEQAIVYLRFSGFSDEQIKAIEGAFTCEDAISRQAVLDEIDRRFDLAKPFKQLIESMPSVTPQQRTGRWIETQEENEAEPFRVWECSECHCVCENGKPTYKYCPQCGAKMEVV